MILIVQFVICVILIIISGARLSEYADTISRKSGFSAGLMGIVLLAAITSFPELFTSLTYVVIDAPDMATGDLIGAVAINIFWIALLGIFCRKGSLFVGQNRSNVLIALITIVMLLVVAGFLFMQGLKTALPRLFNISAASYIIGALYIAGTFIVYRFETHAAKSKTYEGIRHDIIKLGIAGAVIIGSGIWLAYTGKGIADFFGLNEMYVGVLLLAFATTMPEFIVSFTAWKRGSASMAVGNFLGSNFFNIFIILWLDAAMRKDLFSSLSSPNIFSAFLATALTIIAVVAMAQKKQKTQAVKYVSWDSLLIIITFICGHIVLYGITCGVQ